MKKKKIIVDTTMDSRTYKHVRKRKSGFSCIICYRRSGGHNLGCGPWYPKRQTQRNWKKYRKTQYK